MRRDLAHAKWCQFIASVMHDVATDPPTRLGEYAIQYFQERSAIWYKRAREEMGVE